MGQAGQLVAGQDAVDGRRVQPEQVGDLTTRSGQPLKDRITAVRAEDLPDLRSFATGLEKDWDAVIQGLTSHWNSGPVEGRDNHIKMIQRQMFGRAKLPVLGKRAPLISEPRRGLVTPGIGEDARAGLRLHRHVDDNTSAITGNATCWPCTRRTPGGTRCPSWASGSACTCRSRMCARW
ncbi:transposase [Streptomyces sp. NPDC001743]|uniref:transposase n=1 Tax=Streptomyces sp. NPDC001743 TaxID=3154397 RepID=UPI00332BFA2F